MSKANCKKLKSFDAFKEPVKLFMSRRDREHKSHTNYERLGSLYGFYLTVIGVILCFCFFTSIALAMINNDKD